MLRKTTAPTPVLLYSFSVFFLQTPRYIKNFSDVLRSLSLMLQNQWINSINHKSNQNFRLSISNAILFQ